MQRRIVIAALVAILVSGLALLVGCGKKGSGEEGDVIAKVNGKAVGRTDLMSALEDQDVQGGGRVLDALVARQLIRQEAEKRGIKVTEAD